MSAVQKTSRRTLLVAAAGVGILALSALVLMALSIRSTTTDPDRIEEVGSRPGSKAGGPREVLADLERLAEAATDPAAILRRCDEVAVILRGTPQEARWKEIQARALEALKTQDMPK
jgi:hypothetical protein